MAPAVVGADGDAHLERLEQDDVGADDVVALLGGEVVVFTASLWTKTQPGYWIFRATCVARGATRWRSCDSALKLSAHTERTAPSILLDGDGS
jgi:hypothetical protein